MEYFQKNDIEANKSAEKEVIEAIAQKYSLDKKTAPLVGILFRDMLKSDFEKAKKRADGYTNTMDWFKNNKQRIPELLESIQEFAEIAQLEPKDSELLIETASTSEDLINELEGIDSQIDQKSLELERLHKQGQSEDTKDRLAIVKGELEILINKKDKIASSIKDSKPKLEKKNKKITPPKEENKIIHTESMKIDGYSLHKGDSLSGSYYVNFRNFTSFLSKVDKDSVIEDLYTKGGKNYVIFRSPDGNSTTVAADKVKEAFNYAKISQIRTGAEVQIIQNKQKTTFIITGNDEKGLTYKNKEGDAVFTKTFKEIQSLLTAPGVTFKVFAAKQEKVVDEGLESRKRVVRDLEKSIKERSKKYENIQKELNEAKEELANLIAMMTPEELAEFEGRPAPAEKSTDSNTSVNNQESTFTIDQDIKNEILDSLTVQDYILSEDIAHPEIFKSNQKGNELDFISKARAKAEIAFKYLNGEITQEEIIEKKLLSSSGSKQFFNHRIEFWKKKYENYVPVPKTESQLKALDNQE